MSPSTHIVPRRTATRGTRLTDVTCPACRGRRLVECHGYQNDGHGRQEYVYLGRIPCGECLGTGVVPDPADDQARWVGIA